MNTALISLSLLIAVALIWAQLVLFAKHVFPRTARLTLRRARRAASELPADAGPPVAYGSGFANSLSLPGLVAYLLITTFVFVPIPVFLHRHRPTEFIATDEEIIVLNSRHPLIGSRRKRVVGRAPRRSLVVEKRWRHGAAVVSVAGQTFWLFPGHVDALTPRPVRRH